jgi:restriction system protein
MSLFQLRNYADEWLEILSIPKAIGGPTSSSVTREPDETVPIVAESIEQNTRDYILKQFETELKGHPFADFVGHLLNTMGYKTRISPPGADGGIDIIAHRDELGFEPPIVKVQVKSGAGNVGLPEVSSLLGTLAPSGEFGLVVTLASFTPPARNFARNKGNLRLLDGEDVIDLTLQHYDQLDSRYKAIIPLKRVYVPEPVEE